MNHQYVGSNSPVNQTCVEESDVQAAMSSLSRQIVFLNEAVNFLSDRLHSVKAPQPPTTQATLASVPLGGGACQLSSEITGLAAKVEGIVGLVNTNLQLLKL
jgi:hypothetical protein